MNNEGKVPALAEEVLQALAQLGIASEIVLGGYFALQQRMNYRETHDIDAWWRSRSSQAAEASISDALECVAQRNKMTLRVRRFGETISWEFLTEAKKVFSFQISIKSVELEPPLTSAWPPLKIESPAENIASKMNALVGRGSPRDFLDIYESITRKLFTSSQCWSYWEIKNPGVPLESAKQRVLLHLSALELRRPLAQIDSLEERARATEVRCWFKEVFAKR